MFQFTCPSRSTTGHITHNTSRSLVSIHVPLAEHDEGIHVPLAEHDNIRSMPFTIIKVSIHVPLAEHDPISTSFMNAQVSFNSRAPRGARLPSIRP